MKNIDETAKTKFPWNFSKIFLKYYTYKSVQLGNHRTDPHWLLHINISQKSIWNCRMIQALQTLPIMAHVKKWWYTYLAYWSKQRCFPSARVFGFTLLRQHKTWHTCNSGTIRLETQQNVALSNTQPFDCSQYRTRKTHDKHM